jgi:hypothetical protein
MDTDELKMLETALDQAKAESADIEAEMDRLNAEGERLNAEGREWDKTQHRERFLELIRQHGDAARRLIASEAAIRQAKWDQGAPAPYTPPSRRSSGGRGSAGSPP